MIAYRLSAAALVTTCLGLAAAGLAAAAELTGRQILDKVAELHERPYEYEVQRMTLIDKDGNTDVREVRRYARKGKDDTYKYLVVFHDPPGVRGVALLTWQHADKDDDQWLYMPSLGKKMRRIAKGGKRNYFMGTDFTFEDLVSESRDKFRFDRQPDEAVDGVDHYVVDAYPTDDAVKKSSGYKYRRMWVRKDIFVITRVDFFDRRGRAIKRQTVDELAQIEGKLWRAVKTTMDNEKQNHKTVVEVLDRKLDEDAVPAKYFRQRFVTSGKHIR